LFVPCRHWVEVGRIVGTEFPLPSAGLILQQVLDAGLLAHRDAIQELCSGAVKEEELERKLRSVTQQWSTEALTFAEYKQRGPVVLKVGFEFFVSYSNACEDIGHVALCHVDVD
jgi:dynein heavy chain, axonemal